MQCLLCASGQASLDLPQKHLQHGNQCPCVGGAESPKKQSLVGDDTFDYLFVLAQENHCQVQKMVQ